MRLVEFLQPSTETPVESDLRAVRIPLWYLGGSYQAYAAYRSQRFLESVTLNEGAIDRYAEMLNVFKKLDQYGAQFESMPDNLYDSGMEHLQWAMRTLRREDRIVWYMRIRKALMLERLTMSALNTAREANQQEIFDFVNKEMSKAKGKLIKAYGNESEATGAIQQIDNHSFATQVEHFLSMGIDQIDRTVWKNQSPVELLNHFSSIEKEWLARRDSTLNVGDDADRDQHETLIEFPNGMAWVNLNRSSCRFEADAMGHCGNGAANREDETVLSLREPVDQGGRKLSDVGKHDGDHWRPRLTFILNTASGLLGEMKGRANNKPKAELHPYIIALLKHDIIKGITGGGYAPQNNFSMDDLEPDVKEALIEEKPGLGTMFEQYQSEGFSEAVLRRFESVLEQHDIEHGGIVDYEDGTKELILTMHSDPKDFISDYSDGHSTASRVAAYVLDGDYLDGDEYPGDLRDRQELAESFFSDSRYQKDWEKLKAYTLNEYPTEFGYEEGDHGTLDQVDEDPTWDIDDISDVVHVLHDYDDEIYDQIGYAIADGHRRGAENEMYEAFWDWIVNPFEKYGCRLELDDKNRYDGECEVRGDLKEMFRDMGPGEDFLENIAYEGWGEWAEFSDLDEPRYGWSGYEEDAAWEYLSEQLEIPTVDSYEIEDMGKATRSDVNKIKSRLELEFDGEWNKQYNSEVLVSGEDNPVRFSNIREMRGVAVMDIYTPSTTGHGAMPTLFAQTLRRVAKIADEVGVPVVVRGYSNGVLSDMVGEAGFKKVRHDYLRYDPKMNEMKISLGKPNQDKANAFLNELYSMGERHPFNNRMVMLGPIGIEASTWGANIHLSDIVAYAEAGQGKGTEALRVLTDLADKHNVKITGLASAYSKDDQHIQDTGRLAQWYKKNGFEIGDGDEDYGFEIEYHPK